MITRDRILTCSRLLAAFVFSGSGVLAVAQPAPPSDTSRLESSIVILREALQRAAAQHGVDRSAVLGQIDRLLDEGRRDQQVAGARLSVAYALVMAEVRQLAQQQSEPAPDAAASVREDASRPAFEHTRASAGALRDALARIGAEAGGSDTTVKLAVIDRLLGEADGDARHGRWEDARRNAALALDAARTGIRLLREGSTQVHALVFQTPADEYRYELDRYASYRQLFEVTVGLGSVAEPVAKRRAEAEARHTAAKDEVARDDYPAAIRLLEEASNHWIGAMRAAGIDLPG